MVSIATAPQLMDGEYILWQGKPPTGIMFRSSDLLLVPFSLMWGGFAIFWEASVLGLVWEMTEPVPWFFALWGVPFVLIGIYFIAGRFFVDAFLRARTEYFLTNRRAMIARSLGDRKIRSFQLAPGAEVASSELGDGSGTITFGSQPVGGRPNLANVGFMPSGQFIFERVPRIGEVLGVISRVQSGKA